MKQERLDEILEKHKKWLCGQARGKRANLSYADLSYLDLSYADLTNTDFSYANLNNADFSYANLNNADFSYADLRYTVLTKIKGIKVIGIQIDTSRPNAMLYYIPKYDIATTGCFQGTWQEFKDRVAIEHKNNPKILKRYKKVIEFVEFMVEDYKNEE